MRVYLTGSLRNPRVRELANDLRESGFEVFDDWHAAGPKADDIWQDYEEGRGRTYPEALDGHAAWHTYLYDKHHIDHCDVLVLVMPAGKSSHLELGYAKGVGKRTVVFFQDGYPARWDVMYRFADTVTDSQTDLVEYLCGVEWQREHAA